MTLTRALIEFNNNNVHGIVNITNNDDIRSLPVLNEKNDPAIGLSAFDFYRINNVSVTRMAFNDEQACQAVNKVIDKQELGNGRSLHEHHQYFDFKRLSNIRMLPIKETEC